MMLAYLFIVLAMLSRLPEHPWNFTPIAAALLFFGASMPRRQFWIPVALLAGVDVALTTMRYGYPLTADHAITWLWYAGVVLAGSWLAAKPQAWRVASTSLGCAIGFFLVSNFCVWAGWNMYPRSVAGLMECYAAAVPFFRQPVSDVFFSLLFFAIPKMVEACSSRSAEWIG
jgi:hypothetical protein